MRFSVLRLIQATTAVAVLCAVVVYAPRWFSRAALSVAQLGVLAGLVAGGFVYSGRGRIACVAGLAAMAIPLRGGLGILDPAIAAAAAYYLAGVLARFARPSDEERG